MEEICPEMHAYEMHELHDRHHKVSPTLNSFSFFFSFLFLFKHILQTVLYKVPKFRVRVSVVEGILIN